MNYSRIENVMDVRTLNQSDVAVIGVGGAANCVANLARCGVRRVKLFDPDVVSPENIARQSHYPSFIGKPKVEAVADELKRINPDVIVECYCCDVTMMTEEETQNAMSGVDLMICATDNHLAQAWGNRTALRLEIPAVFLGLYRKGEAGEVIFWLPEIISCYRCLTSTRSAKHEQAAKEGRSLDPSSEGCSIFEVTQLDAIGGQVAIGILTRGANDYYGQLIDALGDRNFIQVQLHWNWLLNGRDPVREKLGILTDNAAYFSWNAIAISDPDKGARYCPDCEQYRGHSFSELLGYESRFVPQKTSSTPAPTVATNGGHHAI